MSPGTLTGSTPHTQPARAALPILSAVVVAAVVVTYWPALSARALWLDDEQYLTANPLVQNPSWNSVGRFLGEVLEPSSVTGYYQPLAMISLMLDCVLGGGPGDLSVFHRTSLLLHAANVGLIIILLALMFGRPWPAALAGLLFGLHPLNVETIPWVTERKTLLATFFALICLLCYVVHTRRAPRGWYFASLAACALALLSKPTTTPLPVLLLVLDYWPLRRLSWRTVAEKLPFFVLAGVSAIITFVSQSRAAATVLPTHHAATYFPLLIGNNLAFYVTKMLWPVHLSSYYAVPEPLALSNPAVLLRVLGTCVLMVAIGLSVRRTRALVAGGLFFLVALAPTLGVIGFTDINACDKFAYFPLLGWLLPLVALLGWWWGQPEAGRERQAPRGALLACGLALAMACGVATRGYLANWRDTETLFKYMLRLAPDAPILLNNYGVALASQGRIAEALDYYEKAVRRQPNYTLARVNVGIALRDLGRLDEAVAAFRTLVGDAPRDPVTHFNLANALARQGRTADACAEYVEAVRLNPKYSAALTNWGVALVEAGQMTDAIARLQTALTLNPHDALAHFNLGLALAGQGQFDQAVAHYREALRLRPDSPAVYTNLALALVAQGKRPEAVQALEAALRLDPHDALAHLNLGALAVQAGRPEVAEAHFRAVLANDPDNVEANNNLGVLLAQQDQHAEAIRYLSAAVRLRPDHANAQYALGWSLAATGQSAEAIPHLLRAVELQPGDLEAWARLAAAYAATQQFSDALSAATKARDLAQAARQPAVVQRLEELMAQYQAGVAPAP